MARKTGPPTEEQIRFIEAVFTRYRRLIYKLALGRCRDEALTDEIVSEAMLRLFRSVDTLQGLHEKQLVDYVARTVLNTATDIQRKRQTETRRVIPLEEAYLPEPGPEARLLEAESENLLIRYLYEALEELGDTDRRLLTGKYFDCMSDEALARQLGVKPSAMRMKLMRARKRARRIIERREAEDDG